jgi:TPR repeat protein
MAMTAVQAYEECRQRYMEASWRKYNGEDSYESYKKWLAKEPVFQTELAAHVRVLLGLQNTGDPEVMKALGDAFDMGLGVERNREKAIDCFLSSSQEGNTTAMVRLGRIFKSPSINKLKDAIYWFQKAADAGNTSGMISLGFAFREGDGVPISPVRAAEWFGKAVDAGDSSAKILLAKVYYFSLNATEKALPLLLEAAETGNTDSFKILGRIYGDDRTTYYDFEKAVYWYERVVAGKYEGSAAAARISLAELHLSGKRQPKNFSKAKKYLEDVVADSPETSAFRKEALKLLGKIEKAQV